MLVFEGKNWNSIFCFFPIFGNCLPLRLRQTKLIRVWGKRNNVWSEDWVYILVTEIEQDFLSLNIFKNPLWRLPPLGYEWQRSVFSFCRRDDCRAVSARLFAFAAQQVICSLYDHTVIILEEHALATTYIEGNFTSKWHFRQRHGVPLNQRYQI